MDKKITYDYKNMVRVGQLLNMVKISGIDNIRILAELSMILDSGEIVEIDEKKDKEDKDGDQ